MKYPNFIEEKKLQKMGCDFVIGVDEVGRGPLAGPVVAGAVVILINSKNSLDNKFFLRGEPLCGAPSPRKKSLPHEFLKSSQAKNYFIRSLFLKVKDSKQLSEKQREEIFEAIKNCPDVVWAVGEVIEKVIDKINILQATKLAMQKAVNNLLHKIGEIPEISPIFVLVDGNMRFDKNWFGDGSDYKSIVKGDEKVFSIALASIIAKVYRDNLMKNYAKKYPQYGFEKHKGYGTKKHYENLKKFGACKIHRKTFL